MILFQGMEQTTGDSKLQQIESTNLLNDVGLCRWQVTPDIIRYQRNAGHTLSLYLAGGKGTHRVDQKSKTGAPGKLCVMPQGYETHWNSPSSLDLIHLYFPDELVRRYASQHFEADTRYAQLHDLVYEQDELIENSLRSLAYSTYRTTPGDLISIEERVHSILWRLLSQYSDLKSPHNPLKGGLSAANIKALKRYINDNLADKLTIERIASVVGLSPFHFAHSFKLSFGQSPGQFILNCRIEKARQLLKSKLPVTQISEDCGFNQPSHFANYFKRSVGVTPSAYRQQLIS